MSEVVCGLKASFGWGEVASSVGLLCSRQFMLGRFINDEKFVDQLNDCYSCASD
jgi:hypothetical protein